MFDDRVIIFVVQIDEILHNFLIGWDNFSCSSLQAKLKALLFTSNKYLQKWKQFHNLHGGTISCLIILLCGTVAVVVFVAGDFGIIMFKCALGIKNGENKNTNCVAKRAKANSLIIIL